jgi:hypothetical protein
MAPGTSGAVISGGVGTPRLALPLTGWQAYTFGKERNNVIPFVQKATDASLPRIPVGAIACACVRPVNVKTCGGTVFEPDGVTQSTDCSPGYVPGICNFPGTPTPTFPPGSPTPAPRSCLISLDCSIPNPTPLTNQPTCVVVNDPCAASGKKCAFVQGSGNSAAGIVSCVAGLANVDVVTSQNAGTSTYAPTPPPPVGTPPPGTTPAAVSLSGTGVAGDGLIINSSSIGQITGTCQHVPPSTGDKFIYGVDGKFCTDDDPGSSRGTPQTLLQTSGTATGLITNSYRSPQTLCDTDPTTTPCDIGPAVITGSPFSCANLTAPTPSIVGAGTTGAFTTVNLPTVLDSIVTNQFYYQ